MSKLPEGWAYARLPDLVAANGVFVDGDWVESKDQDPNGDVRLVQLADIGDGWFVDKSNRSLTQTKAEELGCTFLAQGDVLIARMPDPLGRACLFPGGKRQAVTVVDVCIVRGNPEHFDNTWLMHFINSAPFRADIHSLQSGSTRKRISRRNLSTLNLPVPPRAEQTRIVAKLEELLSDLDAGVAELKTAQKKLGQYRQSLLKAAVEGALTAEWRVKNTPKETGAQLLERILTDRRARWEAKQLAKFAEQGKKPPKDWQKKYPEPVQPDTNGLPELPAGWVWASLEQLTEFVTSGSRGWANYYTNSGATFIRSQNINKDWLDMSDIAFVNPPPGSEGARTRVQKDDVLLTITGANVGKTAHVEIQPKEAYVSQHVALIRPVESILAKFLHLFLTAECGGRGQLNKLAYGAGKPGLNLQQVGAVFIPMPSLSEIQALLGAISIHWAATAENETAITKNLKQSTAQRQNILRAAFAGELVPQDPNDEPASALLERIRAERNAQVNKPRGRKNTPKKNGAIHEN